MVAVGPRNLGEFEPFQTQTIYFSTAQTHAKPRQSAFHGIFGDREADLVVKRHQSRGREGHGGGRNGAQQRGRRGR